MDEIERFRIERLLNELKSKKGRGTELISLYIPAGRPIAEVMNILRQEYSTAMNIKDRTTRHHVLDALTVVMQRLKLFRKTPPNGLVIFAGYVAGNAPGDETMEVHVIEPPLKLRTWLYRCDSRFHIDIIEDMVKVKDTYGLIALDRSEAAFALLRGKHLEVVEVITSGIPGKHRAGGQSARRFERIIEQLAHEFYKRIGEHANRIFLKEDNLRGIIVGGPGPSKYEFVEGNYLHYELKDKIIGVFDIGYAGEEGIYELVNRAKDLLSDVQFIKEKDAVNRFLYHLARDTGLGIYGENEVRRALEIGAVDVLLVSEKLGKDKVKYYCPHCKKEFEEIIRSDVDRIFCRKCGGQVKVLERISIVEELARIAKNFGTEVIIVSTETQEGKELLRTFGGIAAILRFKQQVGAY